MRFTVNSCPSSPEVMVRIVEASPAFMDFKGSISSPSGRGHSGTILWVGHWTYWDHSTLFTGCALWLDVCMSFTKPPLFRKNRLTGSGNPTFESYVDGNWSVQPELLLNPPWMYNFYRGTADQKWFCAVVLKGLSVDTEFPCLKSSLYTTFKSGIAFTY